MNKHGADKFKFFNEKDKFLEKWCTKTDKRNTKNLNKPYQFKNLNPYFKNFPQNLIKQFDGGKNFPQKRL